ncbi:L,D-transpeptidase catalytic domain [Jatrophihabitans endophyticus]|uniref:L,D-transpeptidase catalytic domain n=1 Tax=Jatrophihabitans endophyticus TaxID=1206085 RepID=A0A1M5GXB7_9ACTN|nr:L,D-transpeptidase [Jatrophihabitans endophyticus]SHG08364.1 L,D-transpeptidase catalytic domain [Jatrophihabitans endophyticus]
MRAWLVALLAVALAAAAGATLSVMTSPASGAQRQAATERQVAASTASTPKKSRACPKLSGKTIDIDISRQLARMCASGRLVRTTRVTTGASAHGYATPRGTWRISAKQRDTTLHPAAGGAYPVKYWMPYDGAYGLHDSSWQTFAYGSQKYRTRGSHGCTHVPAKTMAWLYRWAPVGTRVRIHR